MGHWQKCKNAFKQHYDNEHSVISYLAKLYFVCEFHFVAMGSKSHNFPFSSGDYTKNAFLPQCPIFRIPQHIIMANPHVIAQNFIIRIIIKA